MSKDMGVPTHPTSKTGFQPSRSDTPPPREARQRFGEGKGGDEDADPEGCNGSIADVEVFHHVSCIRKA